MLGCISFWYDILLVGNVVRPPPPPRVLLWKVHVSCSPASSAEIAISGGFACPVHPKGCQSCQCPARLRALGKGNGNSYHKAIGRTIRRTRRTQTNIQAVAVDSWKLPRTKKGVMRSLARFCGLGLCFHVLVYRNSLRVVSL